MDDIVDTFSFSHCENEDGVEVKSTESQEEKRKEIEYRRAEALLRWHDQFARQIGLEEKVREICNFVLSHHGFPVVKEKAASLGRSVSIHDGDKGSRLYRKIWYGMSGYQSKFFALFLNIRIGILLEIDK